MMQRKLKFQLPGVSRCIRPTYGKFSFLSASSLFSSEWLGSFTNWVLQQHLGAFLVTGKKCLFALKKNSLVLWIVWNSTFAICSNIWFKTRKKFIVLLYSATDSSNEVLSISVSHALALFPLCFFLLPIAGPTWGLACFFFFCECVVSCLTVSTIFQILALFCPEQDDFSVVQAERNLLFLMFLFGIFYFSPPCPRRNCITA